MQASLSDTRIEAASHLDLHHALEQAAHLLPSQGPIGVFIHHNTLHAFQHLPFDQAIAAGSEIFGAEPFMSEAAYRQCIGTGRILTEDIREVVIREPNQIIFSSGRKTELDRHSLRVSLLASGQTSFDEATIDWVLNETALLESRGSGPDGHALFGLCLEWLDLYGASQTPDSRAPQRLPDIAGVCLDDIVHPLLIRLCASYLDQGTAYWPMPNRQFGFLGAVRTLMGQPGSLSPETLDGLAAEFRYQSDQNMTADEVILRALAEFGVPVKQWEHVLAGELLALPGWAGTFRQLEINPGLAPYVPLSCSLAEFLAVRLTIKYAAASGVAGKHGMGPAELRQGRDSTVMSKGSDRTGSQRAAAAELWDVIGRLGLDEKALSSVEPSAIRAFVQEVQAFNNFERRRLLHLAYERNHEQEVLQSLLAHRRTLTPDAAVQRPFADVFFCIDEREESLRRHLEESAPEVRTFGAAGFFGVAMQYTGIDDAHGAALCPVVVKPAHSVKERALSVQSEVHEKRLRRRRGWALLTHSIFVSSRSLFRGWLSAVALWPVSLIPLVTRVLAPGRYGALEIAVKSWLIPQPLTELDFARSDEDNTPDSHGLLAGFSLGETADRVAGTLKNAGFTRGFARLVVILGHGSTSLNNPHESAHDCGACGGGRGGPNGRVFAAMANSPEVRAALVLRGIEIPADTWFVGGYHDTSNADILLFDLDKVPGTHAAETQRLRKVLDVARQLDAEERVRRFEAAADCRTSADSLRHVQDRAHRLSEPRPEYGHATNSVCIVGRRASTCGLFLDRRAFLVSYDASTDPEDAALSRVLGAVVPVCGGISLEYYFSFVDNERYGCGTKLPHNVTGLIGVMNGSSSDLRTGLPWQMVEVHEPVRILFVVETTPARVMKVMSANPELTEFLQNQWIRLATMDPESGEIHVWRNGEFDPLEAQSKTLATVGRSADWFRGKLDHLPIVRVGRAA